MSRYVVCIFHRNGKNIESEPTELLGEAQDLAHTAAHTAKVVTILKEGGEQDYCPHPDNKGKFFLHLIVK